MPNRLAHETSPYLRQHQDNPVDWYPWGEEALHRAEAENKPIFLSIGYAACHWCHVMAHESFEDPQTARYLNEHFISIKVDREERPDLDDIYMQAVVTLTGRGGWPMSIFLTPDLKPFYGGTYFPPLPRYGMPSFLEVLHSIRDAWTHQTADIHKSAQALTAAIQAQQDAPTASGAKADLSEIVKRLSDTYDWHLGGWGQAPKFPQPMIIEFLAQRAQAGDQQALRVVADLLGKMAQGGMYDHVGGGFHRYSTDAAWLVPHFEKMLYDNAQLALVYLHGYSLTKIPAFKAIAIQTLTFIQRELTNPEGGFISSLDADTVEGEGRFYAWQRDELMEALGEDDFTTLAEFFDISEQGNFEDGLILLRYQSSLNAAGDQRLEDDPQSKRLEAVLNRLRHIRNQRPRPERDTKVIAEWNAYAIEAFARAGALLGREDLVQTARTAANFLLKNLQPRPGVLMRAWNDGKAHQPATLADYSALILGLYALYEVDSSPAIYLAMRNFLDTIRCQFASDQALFYDTDQDVSHLIVRPRNLQDNATPSGNALAAKTHWVIGQYEHAPAMLDQLVAMLAPVQSQMSQYPTVFGYWLQCADLATRAGQQVALVSDGDRATLQPFLDIYHSEYRPGSILAASFEAPQSIPPLLAGRSTVDRLPTAYVCHDFTCQNPVTDPQSMKDLLAP